MDIKRVREIQLVIVIAEKISAANESKMHDKEICVLYVSNAPNNGKKKRLNREEKVNCLDDTWYLSVLTDPIGSPNVLAW